MINLPLIIWILLAILFIALLGWAAGFGNHGS